MDLLPSAFLFRYAIPVPFANVSATETGRILNAAIPPVPMFSALDDPNELITLRLCWNMTGLGIGLDVHGKSLPPHATKDLQGDICTIWINTRDTQGAHRASRFCHEFAIAPHTGKASKWKPQIQKRDIVMARENSAELKEPVHLFSEPLDDGYRLEAWLPIDALHGFDPEQAPRIGFHAIVFDKELGECPLTVGTEFATDRDPSLWTALDLVPPNTKTSTSSKRKTKAVSKRSTKQSRTSKQKGTT